MKFLNVLACLSLAVSATGCEYLQALYEEPIDLSVNLQTPPVHIDVTEKIESAEAEVCNDGDSEQCVVLKALDRTDDDEVGNPPRVPEEFPISVEVTDDQGNPVPNLDGCDEPNPMDCPQLVVDVEEFAEDQGLFDDLNLRSAVPVDITEQLNVSSPDAIQAVNLENIGLKWKDNSLTFDTVDLDIYMTLEYIEDADADELIESGAVEKIGTLDRQYAETDGTTPIRFDNDAGEELFNDGLKKLRFTLVTALPEGTRPTLSEGSAANMRRKPLGEVDLALVATIRYTVVPSELVGNARDAYDRGDFDL